MVPNIHIVRSAQYRSTVCLPIPRPPHSEHGRRLDQRQGSFDTKYSVPLTGTPAFLPILHRDQKLGPTPCRPATVPPSAKLGRVGTAKHGAVDVTGALSCGCDCDPGVVADADAEATRLLASRHDRLWHRGVVVLASHTAAPSSSDGATKLPHDWRISTEGRRTSLFGPYRLGIVPRLFGVIPNDKTRKVLWLVLSSHNLADIQQASFAWIRQFRLQPAAGN